MLSVLSSASTWTCSRSGRKKLGFLRAAMAPRTQTALLGAGAVPAGSTADGGAGQTALGPWCPRW